MLITVTETYKFDTDGESPAALRAHAAYIASAIEDFTDSMSFWSQTVHKAWHRLVECNNKIAELSGDDQFDAMMVERNRSRLLSNDLNKAIHNLREQDHMRKVYDVALSALIESAGDKMREK